MSHDYNDIVKIFELLRLDCTTNEFFFSSDKG